MSIIKNILLSLIILQVTLYSTFTSAGLLSDTCYATNGHPFYLNKSPFIGNDTLNLSDLFTTSNTYETTRSTNWSGQMWCTYATLTDNVYYYSPLLYENKYFVGFEDQETGTKQWFIITTKLLTSKTGVNGIFGMHSLGYNINYTLKIELSPEELNIGDSYNMKSTKTGSLVIAPVAAAGKGKSNETAATTWVTNNWGTTKRWLAYQQLTLTYTPNVTTCTTSNQDVILPTTSIDAIRNGNAPLKLFPLYFACGGTTKGVANRSVKAWLYSSDIVSTDPTIMRNPSSTANDVGIMITDYYGDPVIVSQNSETAGDSQLFLDITKGKTFDSEETSYPFATYALTGENPQPGTVNATATVMIEYY